jgi:hypothetical protein
MALRYVVLRHEGIAEPHFDLMFEIATESALVTWRSMEWPIHTGSILTKLADHRRAYLDYEGPISGDRGFVRRVTSGFYLLDCCNADQFDAVFSDTGVEFTLTRQTRDHWFCAIPDSNSA